MRIDESEVSIASDDRGTAWSNMLAKPSEVEDLDALLALYDEQFVIRTYEVLLSRAPDAGGFTNYLSQVRNGVSKAQIIAEIALSEEGRSKAVNLKGLNRLVLEQARRRASVWQWIMHNVFNGVFARTERQLRSIENQIGRLQYAIDEHSKQLSSILVISRGTISATNVSSVSPRDSLGNLPPADGRSLTPPVRQNYLDLQSAIAVARNDLSKWH